MCNAAAVDNMDNKMHRPQILADDMNKLQAMFSPDDANPPAGRVFHRVVLYLDEYFDEAKFATMMKDWADASEVKRQ